MSELLFNTKMYKGNLFLDELIIAGIDPTTVRVETAPDGSFCRVFHTNANDETVIRAVEAAHDATQNSVAERTESVSNTAKADVSVIPNWGTWDESTALSWHDTNIGALLPIANLTEANTVLANLETENRALIRLMIALRNRTWPDLQI